MVKCQSFLAKGQGVCRGPTSSCVPDPSESLLKIPVPKVQQPRGSDAVSRVVLG